MFYSPNTSESAVRAVVSDYTLMSEYPPRNPREALEEDFVLDFLVAQAQETPQHSI